MDHNNWLHGTPLWSEYIYGNDIVGALFFAHLLMLQYDNISSIKNFQTGNQWIF